MFSPALNRAWNGTHSAFSELFLDIVHENSCTRDLFLALSLKSSFRRLVLSLLILKVLIEAEIDIRTPLRAVFCLPLARKGRKP
jgi:hypothetical protein